MIQQLPTKLRELFATTDIEWLHQCWHYVWLDYGVVPVVFDEDGSDDMLREFIDKNIRFDEVQWCYEFIPQATIVIDVTDCQDWEPSSSVRIKAPIKHCNSKRSAVFPVRFASEVAIGPDGNKRVFYVFEIEERDE